MHIGVDIDDVVAEWYYGSHDACVQAGITNGVTPRTWTPYEEYGCKDQVWYDTLHKALLRGYLLDLPVVPGAVAALRRMKSRGHKIHLITARGYFQDGDLIREHTRLWLRKKAIPHDSLHFTQKKGAVAYNLGLDAFVDDHVRNTTAVSAFGVPSYLVNRPWNENEDWPARYRVTGLKEFAEKIDLWHLTLQPEWA